MLTAVNIIEKHVAVSRGTQKLENLCHTGRLGCSECISYYQRKTLKIKKRDRERTLDCHKFEVSMSFSDRDLAIEQECRKTLATKVTWYQIVGGLHHDNAICGVVERTIDAFLMQLCTNGINLPDKTESFIQGMPSPESTTATSQVGIVITVSCCGHMISTSPTRQSFIQGIAVPKMHYCRQPVWYHHCHVLLLLQDTVYQRCDIPDQPCVSNKDHLVLDCRLSPPR